MTLTLNLTQPPFIWLIILRLEREKQNSKPKKLKKFSNLISVFMICRWLQTIMEWAKLLREQPYYKAEVIKIFNPFVFFLIRVSFCWVWIMKGVWAEFFLIDFPYSLAYWGLLHWLAMLMIFLTECLNEYIERERLKIGEL